MTYHPATPPAGVPAERPRVFFGPHGITLPPYFVVTTYSAGPLKPLRYGTPTTGTAPYIDYTGLHLFAATWALLIFISLFHLAKFKMTKPQRKIKPTAKVKPKLDPHNGDDDDDTPGDDDSPDANDGHSNYPEPTVKLAAKAAPDSSPDGLDDAGDRGSLGTEDNDALGKPKRALKLTTKAKAMMEDDTYGDCQYTGGKNSPKTTQPKRNTEPNAKGKAAEGQVSEDELAISDDNDSEWEDETEFLTTNPKSPFVHMDLIAEYLKPEFQALLTDDDKKEIADLLPDHINLTADGQLPEDFVRYNTDFRSAVRQYQNDLEAGHLDPTWLAEADTAMEERAQGRFDQWKEEHFEEFWGQKQKVDPKALAGQSSTVKLRRLVAADLCKVGDVWSYSRMFGQGKSRVLVEKEFKLVEIEGDTLTFAIPPGTAKYARRLKEDAATVASQDAGSPAPVSPASSSSLSAIPSDVADVIPVPVTSLSSLEEKIVAINGQFTGKVNGNAWKCTRVKRNEQDLGSLFEIRENFFVYGATK